MIVLDNDCLPKEGCLSSAQCGRTVFMFSARTDRVVLWCQMHRSMVRSLTTFGSARHLDGFHWPLIKHSNAKGPLLN